MAKVNRGIIYGALLLSCLVEISTAALKTQLQFSMIEESSPGALIGNIGEEAGLIDEYGEETFKTLNFSFLDKSADHVNLFSVQETGGALLSASRIDRDLLCPRQPSCSVQINIQTYPVEYMHIIKVTIVIRDINDNNPSFAEPIVTRTISEASAMPGSRIALNTATDPDSPTFGVRWYSLVGSEDKFELKQTNNTGGSIDIFLQLKKQLDREVQSSYRVQVVAYDGGATPNSGTVTVDINVLDINDNNPEFDNQSYQVAVPENIPLGRTILNIHASDPDEGMYGEIVYGLQADQSASGGLPFWINSTSGDIIINGLVDHEEKSMYSLTVTAKNRDPDSLTTSAKLVVNVVDENDNPPKIKVSGEVNGRVRIPENVLAGRFVAHLTIDDPDSEGDNKKFSCFLDRPTLFKLEQLFETEFKIVTKGRFDRESVSRYDVSVTCQDRGSPQQTSTHRITVEISDLNDNYPVFSMTTYVSGVIENNPVGSSLLQVTASDRDSGLNQEIVYSIEDKAKDAVNIDSATGNISSKVSFDYEQLQRYEFKVFATDRGDPAQTSTATVVVIIQDYDDEVPQFSENIYTFRVPENQPGGMEVKAVKAVDKDSDPFNKFSYSIDQAHSNASVIEKFSIDKKSGMISTRKVLNRELQGAYKIVVLATSDRSRPYVTSSATVLLEVVDTNDNSPYVTYPNDYNNTLFLSNRLPANTYVTRVNAFDADLGENALLLYTISSGDSEEHFFIDKYTGEFFVKKDLSDINYKNFVIKISVSDAGTPPLMVEAMLNIVVNHSIPFGDSPMLTKQNLTIVIAIASISGLIMVVLVIAIVAILRQQRAASSPKNKYLQGQKLSGQELQTAVSVPIANSPNKLKQLPVGSNNREYGENGRDNAGGYHSPDKANSRPQITSVSSSPSSSSSQVSLFSTIYHV